MTTRLYIRPVFGVANIAAAFAYDQAALGFREDYWWPDPDEAYWARRAQVSRYDEDARIRV